MKDLIQINSFYTFGIVSSRGGHLFQLLQLKKLCSLKKRFWVTFPGKDVDFYLKNEKKLYAFYPESRNIVNTIKNFFVAFKIFRKKKPKYLLSCCAAIAVPFFIVGKIFFHTKLIYIEPYDFIAYPSLTGKILYNLVDLFLVQHKHQLKWFPKAKFYGSLL